MPKPDDAWEELRRRPRQFMREPQRIDDVLSRLLSRRGYAQAQQQCALQDVWSQLLPPDLARDSRPGAIRRGTLDVVARSSLVVQELTFQTHSILKKLTQLAPETGIKKLKFRVGEIA